MIVLLKFRYVRWIFCFLRALYFIKFRSRLVSFDRDLTRISEKTIFSNKRRLVKNNKEYPHPTAKYIFGIDTDFFGSKSDFFISIFKNISGGDLSFRNMKALVIGPRNESELYNFRSHGFQKHNLDAIDLFSYSEQISVMDMHDLSALSKKYDVVYAGSVIIYSEDRYTALSEMLRVTVTGGFVAITATISSASPEDLKRARGYVVGSKSRFNSIDDLRRLFDDFSTDVRIVFCSPTQRDDKFQGLVIVQKIN